MQEAGVKIDKKYFNSHVLYHKHIDRMVYAKIGL